MAWFSNIVASVFVPVQLILFTLSGHDHYLADMNDEENGKNNETDRVCKDCRSYMGSGDKVS